MKQEPWEIEFDNFIEKKTDFLHTNGDSQWLKENKNDLVKVKDFIRSLLASQRKQVKEEVMKILKECTDEWGEVKGTVDYDMFAEKVIKWLYDR